MSIYNLMVGSGSKVVTPGAQNFLSNGTFVVPAYNTLIVYGFGGGASASENRGAGQAGGTTSFGTYLTASGGAPGVQNSGGTGGVGSGGDTNYTGSTGTPSYGSTSAGAGYGGSGGNAGGYGVLLNAGSGGAGAVSINPGVNGGNYGGGGSGVWPARNYSPGSGGGGGGGAFYKTFNPGSLTVGDSISVTIGQGGAAITSPQISGFGAQGAIFISWS